MGYQTTGGWQAVILSEKIDDRADGVIDLRFLSNILCLSFRGWGRNVNVHSDSTVVRKI